MTRASFSPRKYSAFADADAFLRKGKNPNQRTIQNNTSLRRIDIDTIAVVLHHTAVVTYHRPTTTWSDGTYTIFGGGWNTVTTKDRIGAYSPFRAGSDGNGSWVLGYTGEHTPAKVQKCRRCSKTGPVWSSDIVCDPAAYFYGGHGGYKHPTMCKGGTEEHAVEYVSFLNPETLKYESNWDEHYESRYVKPCEHGETQQHQYAACEHGVMGRHVTGKRHNECHQCNGTGRFDYGSKPIPVLVTAHQAFRMDAECNWIEDVSAPDTYAMPYIKPLTPLEDKTSFAWEMGETISFLLRDAFGTLNATMRCPVAGTYDKASTVVLNLRETHKWDDDRISNWLRSLPLYESA